MALAGSWLADRHGVGSILLPLAVVQTLAVAAGGTRPRDPGLWAVVAAMVLDHAGNAPGGVYLGRYRKRELQALERMLAYALAVSLVAWMAVVRPAGRPPIP